MFKDQKSYEAYYSKEAKAQRQAEFEAARDKVIAQALALCEEGDREGARELLFNVGIDPAAVGI